MLYAAKLLNHRGYFRRIASLPTDRYNEKAVRKVERFLYRASCAAAGLEALYNAERDAIFLANRYKGQIKWPPNRRIIISGDMIFGVYQQIPPILTALVDLQNQIPEIFRLSTGGDGSLPNSLNSWQKKDFDGAPEAEKVLLRSYWNSGGKYLRDLRDVLEHHDMLGDVSFWEAKTFPGSFLVFLPDNPDSKTYKNFTYTQEKDAFDTLNKGLLEIHLLLDNICRLNGIEEGNHTASIKLAHAGNLEPRQERTLGILIEGIPQTSQNGDTHLQLSTTEIVQVVPSQPDAGNIAARKLKLDSEIED